MSKCIHGKHIHTTQINFYIAIQKKAEKTKKNEGNLVSLMPLTFTRINLILWPEKNTVITSS
jgi:hypothetical protein